MDNSVADGLTQLQCGDAAGAPVPPQNLNVVHQTESTLILQQGDGNVGIKVLIDHNRTKDEIISILEHEQRVSNFLSQACPRRKVLELGTHKGFYAFHFEWVEGVTAGQWVQSVKQNENGGDIMSRLHVAVAIVKALSSLHEGGVTHGNLSLENIVLTSESDVHYSATLIDLANAVILSDDHIGLTKYARLAHVERMKVADMKALGNVLRIVLCGKDLPDSAHEDQDTKEEWEEDAGERARTKKGKKGGQSVTNMPFYLMILVSALIEPSLNIGGSFKYQYRDGRDVLCDLQAAIKKPEIYLKPIQASDMATKSLQMPKHSFYGRLSEITMVKQSLDVVMKSGGQPSLVVVSGYAGAGKTTLMKQITKPITEYHGFVITCIFDRTVHPDTVLAAAFDSFFGDMHTSENLNTVQSIRCSIRETMGEHVDVLKESIPNLRAFMEAGDDADLSSKSLQSFNHVAAEDLAPRWKFLLSKLVSALSSGSHPIAIIFEDLHWSDQGALESLQMIMMDKSIRYCLYFVSYRDNDKETTHNITSMIDFVQMQGLQTYNITLGAMGKEAANCLVSETLCMPPSLCQHLSIVLHNKTGGIILFMINFLQSLHEKGLIRFSLSDCKWVFDILVLGHEEISNDIVLHLSERLLRLPKLVQDGLQIATCLGSSFDLDTFQKADSYDGLSAKDFLHIVTECGFLREHSPGQYSWGHAKIQDAAQSLVPISKLEGLHLLVGTRIYLKTDPSALYYSHNLIHIVRNMNMGIRVLETDEQKKELAQLNLLAGCKSAESSAFYSATNYFMIGIGLLGDDWHDKSYKLGMELFNAAVEGLFTTGNVSLLQSTIEIPLRRAKTLEDRLFASYTFIRYLMSSGRLEEAMDECFSILSQFGESLPNDVTPQVIHLELVKTKGLLNNFSKDDFLHLPKVQDKMKQWLHKIMHITSRVAFHKKAEYVSLIACRMIQISIDHGWCSYSAFGLSTLGHSLICITKDIEAGFCWIKRGIELLHTSLKATDIANEIKILYHVFCSFLKEPFQASREVLIDTHQEAMMVGQIEFAMASFFHFCRLSFMCGQDLSKGELNSTSLASKMAQLKQVQNSLSLASHHSMILSLMGAQDTTKPFEVLDGNFSNEDDLLEFSLKTDKLGVAQGIYSNRLFLGFLFKRYEEAAKMAELYRGRQIMRFLDVYHVFFEGLIALHLARRRDNNEKKWIEIAERAISSFQMWNEHCNWNFENKLFLLTAELYHCRGEHDEAEEKYDASVLSAQKHRFVHEEGIALELMGNFFKKNGKVEAAKKKFKGARVCYEQWGAAALVDLLEV